MSGPPSLLPQTMDLKERRDNLRKFVGIQIARSQTLFKDIVSDIKEMDRLICSGKKDFATLRRIQDLRYIIEQSTKKNEETIRSFRALHTASTKRAGVIKDPMFIDALDPKVKQPSGAVFFTRAQAFDKETMDWVTSNFNNQKTEIYTFIFKKFARILRSERDIMKDIKTAIKANALSVVLLSHLMSIYSLFLYPWEEGQPRVSGYGDDFAETFADQIEEISKKRGGIDEYNLTRANITAIACKRLLKDQPQWTEARQKICDTASDTASFMLKVIREEYIYEEEANNNAPPPKPKKPSVVEPFRKKPYDGYDTRLQLDQVYAKMKVASPSKQREIYEKSGIIVVDGDINGALASPKPKKKATPKKTDVSPTKSSATTKKKAAPKKAVKKSASKSPTPSPAKKSPSTVPAFLDIENILSPSSLAKVKAGGFDYQDELDEQLSDAEYGALAKLNKTQLFEYLMELKRKSKA